MNHLPPKVSCCLTDLDVNSRKLNLLIANPNVKNKRLGHAITVLSEGTVYIKIIYIFDFLILLHRLSVLKYFAAMLK